MGGTELRGPVPALADLEDKGSEYEVRANLAGVRKENPDVRLHGRVLSVRAREVEEKEKKVKTYLDHERSYQGYTRSLELPGDVQPDRISARYEDGVRTLAIPKVPPQPEKRIPVG